MFKTLLTYTKRVEDTEWQEEVISLVSEHGSNAVMLRGLFEGCRRVEWLQEEADVHRHLRVTGGIQRPKGLWYVLEQFFRPEVQVLRPNVLQGDAVIEHALLRSNTGISG